MNKQTALALISVIALVLLSAAVGFGAYTLLSGNSNGSGADAADAGDGGQANQSENETAVPGSDSDYASGALDLAGIERPACPSPTIPGVGLELPCLSEREPATAAGVGKSPEQGSAEQGSADQHSANQERADVVHDDAVTIVNMWAWWCQPCREEIPYLEQVHKQHPEWQIVGVHADQNAKNGAGMLDEMGVDFVSYQDSHNKFATELGLPGVIPITIVYVGETQKKVLAQPFRSADEIIESIEGVVQ
ncbi:TlpA disulfide reductase family protein [Corynebacterium sp. MSK297]|uniref:TlpA family protein disulfide reductase n=1 Tax=Corynebacterium sp. MSK297 TaxID=3050221 RepID=UPI00254E2444|nr:TlpA disulfide reductase family protein [Corynebacterium sp. MSK297]MDK8845393.1 TlpA disulfide reductase family protein [Corynebacterium sp. MSK297]